jgi:hypothetical protein
MSVCAQSRIASGRLNVDVAQLFLHGTQEIADVYSDHLMTLVK